MRIHGRSLPLSWALLLFAIWTEAQPHELKAAGSASGTGSVEIHLSWVAEVPPPKSELQIQFWRAEPRAENSELRDADSGSLKTETARADSRIGVRSRVPGFAKVELPAGRWRVTVADEGFFSEGMVEIGTEMGLSEGGGGGHVERIDLAVLPSSWVTATIVVPKGAKLPQSARLHVKASSAAASPGDDIDARVSTIIEARCAVSKRGWLECKAPRGYFDLRFDFSGFASVYRWSQGLGNRSRLGMIALRPGASLSGWIVAPDKSSDLSSTAVSLVEMVADRHGADPKRLRRLSATAAESGFFQFTGLGPGLFSFEAHHPSYALTRLEGVALTQGQETVLDPLELQEAASLVVELDPQTDPFHGLWRLRLVPSDRGSSTEGTVSAEGEWRSEALTPGDYRLEILDSRSSRWVGTDTVIFPGSNQVELKVDSERLEGLVLWQGEPLVGARVALAQHRGNMQIAAKTDEEGRFFVFLKGGLTWDIDIVHHSLHVEAHFGAVEVPLRDPADRWPKKTFRIPSTRLFGDVYYRDGSKVEEPTGFQISSIDLEPPLWLSRLKPADGFEVYGLAPGRYRISASFDESSSPKRGESRPIEFALEEEGESGPLRLEIEESRKLQGQVLAPGGAPIHAARLFADLESPSGEWLSLSLPSTFTDSDGVFVLDLPSAAQGLQITTLAPGYAFYQERLTLGAEEKSAVISLSEEYGSVQLLYDEAPGELTVAEQRRLTFLLYEGIPMRQVFLRLWSQMHPAPGGPAPLSSRWSLPAMPPGTYRACLRTPEVQSLLATLSPLPPAWVAEFCGDPSYLSPGGVLEVAVEAPRLDS